MVNYNRLLKKFINFDIKNIEPNLLYENYDNFFIKEEGKYISPTELIMLLYYDKINSEDLVDFMVKYKIKTTNLGLYVLGVYPDWNKNYKLRNKYIKDKTYAIIDNYATEHYMYGTYKNYENIKKIFEDDGLLITVNSDKKHMKVHDNPIFDPENNDVSDSKVMIYDGNVKAYWKWWNKNKLCC
jgi:hypothetical protein